MVEFAWLAIAIPLVSSALLLVAGERLGARGAWMGVAASASAAAVAIVALVETIGRDPYDRSQQVHLFEWITGGELTLNAGLLVDPLSLTFAILITFVGTLIHVYSVAYMEHDPNRVRFFAYLNLFIAAMLLLVLADSFLLLFVGWEGVGLASYLLIGFWSYNPEYASAAKKAFVVNRIGDMGLIIAMALIFAHVGSLDFASVFAAAPGLSEATLTAIGILLLVGATGKSAQFPLQSWLGDAMAGPTPVSALIHAATMVTAGVYLIVRANPIYAGAPTALLVVAAVGTLTLVMGAVIGMAKDDIKKALAASTMSQIGYMMLAAGLGPAGYAYAIFHLVTHGFFKAGMFLGAGSVMHGMNNQVDVRGFGGLSRVMKITWVTFGLGWLAILGVPPFSGFWSKDKIIETAFVGEGWQPWVFGTSALIAAGITAYYMSRLFFMTFHGSKRWDPDQKPHESPALMTWPMIVLSVGSVALGYVLVAGDTFTTWLKPVVGYSSDHDPVLSVPVIIGLTLTLVVIGVAIAYLQYLRRDVPREAPVGSFVTVAARNDLFQDAVADVTVVRPTAAAATGVVETDRALVRGSIDGIARSFVAAGSLLSRFQDGRARSYIASILLGTLLVLGIVVWGVV